jgi:hypothetical protein
VGRILIIIGLIALAVGLAFQFAPWLVNWFGKLPGDIDYRSERTRIFVPITSMLIISAILSLILYLARRQ